MGNSVTAAKLRVALSPIKREAQLYNIEEKAFKHLDKQEKSQVGKAAPKYPSKSARIPESEQIQYEDTNAKDDQLIKRMQKIALSRVDGPGEVKAAEPKPQLSRPRDEFIWSADYGYMEPEVIPEGKCTLRQALEFISKHQDSESYNADKIAADYNLKPQDVQNILNSFLGYKIHLPKKFADQMPHLKEAIEKTKYNQPPRQYSRLTGGMDERIYKDPMK